MGGCVISVIVLLSGCWNIAFDEVGERSFRIKNIDFYLIRTIMHPEKIFLKKTLKNARKPRNHGILSVGKSRNPVGTMLIVKPYSHVTFLHCFSLRFKMGCMHSYGGVRI